MILFTNTDVIIFVPANFRKFKEKMTPKSSTSEDKEVSYSSFGLFSSIFLLLSSLALFLQQLEKHMEELCSKIKVS